MGRGGPGYTADIGIRLRSGGRFAIEPWLAVGQPALPSETPRQPAAARPFTADAATCMMHNRWKTRDGGSSATWVRHRGPWELDGAGAESTPRSVTADVFRGAVPAGGLDVPMRFGLSPRYRKASGAGELLGTTTVVVERAEPYVVERGPLGLAPSKGRGHVSNDAGYALKSKSPRR